MKLITSGCSFSECISVHIDTWPRHLARELPKYEHISVSRGSQGNGLISRRLIHQVTEQLKNNDASNLLVGIMWSGLDRHDYFTQNFNIGKLNWQENPTKFVKDSAGAWVILNPWWDIPPANLYYSKFYDRIGHCVYTCEHILRTQWFLKSHNIKYFMSTYTSEVFPDIMKTHSELDYLYNQIDFSNFLPVVGEYEWCKDSSNFSFPSPPDQHPGTEQHKEFTDQVIIPFLKNKNYI